MMTFKFLDLNLTKTIVYQSKNTKCDKNTFRTFEFKNDSDYFTN